VGRPLQVGGSFRPAPLRVKVCACGCNCAFIGHPNALFRPECAARRELARSRLARQRLRGDPAWAAHEREMSRAWDRAQRSAGWPVPCAICREPVPMLRGRRKKGALCLRCRQESREWRGGRGAKLRGATQLRLKRPAPGPWRHYRRWTAHEATVLRRLWAAGTPADVIGRAMRRTPGSVRRHAGFLRLGRRARVLRSPGAADASARDVAPVRPEAAAD
jgi:hypothetical protein